MTEDYKTQARHIAMRPAEFVAAVRAGVVEYTERHAGISLGGTYVGSYAPTVSGSPVIVAMAGGANAA